MGKRSCPLEIEDIDTLINMLDAKKIGEGVYEKRKSSRRKTDIRLRFMKANRNGDYVEDLIRNVSEARLVDISTTGASLVTSAIFYIGDSFFCETIERKFHFLAEMKIVHFTKKTDGIRYGCRFVKIHRSDKESKKS